ncbi:hypothetical protein [Thalassospira sp.]|uniref:hypothetical protein n=1 Tax=Thalassospira sp. TaxID=1912094 RepID=UPI000C3D3D30|nr:hypothetical protein [Thalassospira sp.]MBC06265.1 hypothetical protein [Thalassospira sp.]|tara:strand:+ start:2143 stop:3090 length:948 start_codon:yes stop_codon:yes gene_type:complete
MRPDTGSPRQQARAPIRLALSFALYLLTLFANGPLHAAEPLEIRLPVRESEFDDVLACQLDPDSACRSCLADHPSSASLVIYSILQEALTTGGIKAKVKPVLSPNSERSRKMVSDGLADVKSDWEFNIDPDPDLLKSAPILRKGEFEKGVYVSQDAFILNGERRISDLHDMRAVSIRTWRLDWQALENLAPKSLTSAPTTLQIYSLINAGRADFTLLEFSSEPDLARRYEDITLYPMPGVKVILPDSQHFMVSRRLTGAQNFIKALDHGLTALRQSGFIRQCMVNSGIINEKVADWKILNPLAATAGAPKTSQSQ